MKDYCTYLVQLRGQVTENEINRMSPLTMVVVQTDTTATLVSISADQSGLIGLLRHLHGRGFMLLSVTCEQ